MQSTLEHFDMMARALSLQAAMLRGSDENGAADKLELAAELYRAFHDGIAPRAHGV